MTLQVLNSKKVDNNATFTTGLPSKTTFDSCMAKQGHDRFVSKILLHQRYQNIHKDMNNLQQCCHRNNKFVEKHGNPRESSPL